MRRLSSHYHFLSSNLLSFLLQEVYTWKRLTIDKSSDNGIIASIGIAPIRDWDFKTNIKVGGQVCVSEGCSSSYDAQLSAYRHVNWASFPYRSIINSSWVALVPVLGATMLGGVRWTVWGRHSKA